MSYESARLLADRIRRRELSAVEALDAFLARIDAYDKDLNAVVSVDADLAREAARAADDTPATGPLHGVPMTLKDGHDVAGLRTTVGHAGVRPGARRGRRGRRTGYAAPARSSSATPTSRRS